MPDGTVPSALRHIARAPADIDVLEFALKWRKNPEEIRQQWDLRDIYWLQLVEQAQILAEPEIRRRQAERAERDRRLKRPKKK